jgi:crossover junction endodeoxyribonuclease RuvC
MRVLGVDPGTVATGWGVIDEVEQRLTYVAGGVIRARGPLAQRLAQVYEQAQRILSDFVPSCVSLEKTFVGENVQSAFRLGEARGAILVATAQAGVPVREYSPAEIKVAVVGHGRAPKEQMQTMVARLLALRVPPAGDEADALGAAICHLHSAAFAAQVEGQAHEQRPPRTGRTAFPLPDPLTHGTVDKREPHPSRRSQKKGAPQGERKLFSNNNRTARPEEPPSSGGVSKGASVPRRIGVARR